MRELKPCQDGALTMLLDLVHRWIVVSHRLRGAAAAAAAARAWLGLG